MRKKKEITYHIINTIILLITSHLAFNLYTNYQNIFSENISVFILANIGLFTFLLATFELRIAKITAVIFFLAQALNIYIGKFVFKMPTVVDFSAGYVLRKSQITTIEGKIGIVDLAWGLNINFFAAFMIILCLNFLDQPNKNL